jgi:heat-inducible transcriptional repressor
VAGRQDAAWSGRAAAELRQLPAPAGGPDGALEATLRATLAGMLERHDRRHWDIRYHDGLANVLSQPEFTRAADERRRRHRLANLLAMVEHGEVVRDLLPAVAQQGGLRVLIGEEQPEELRDYALVLCPYGDEGTSVGVLGLIGPTRLDYPRAINGARYVAGILSRLMQEWHGVSRGTSAREGQE